MNDPAHSAAARQEAAIALGKAIAIGMVPVVGQAIDAYDTVESALVLHRAPAGEPLDAARFDFVLALIGWIPGLGDGVKKSLRIVERDPQRFAPVLFDLLRFVLRECGIETSPEALLDAVFDAAKLRAQLTEIERGVVSSSGFEALPEALQDAVRGTLRTAPQNMPTLVGVVQKRLGAWKKLQRDSSADVVPHGRSAQALPRAKDGGTARRGASRAEHAQANTATHGTLATQALDTIANDAIGISGEHIADYICAYDARFGWGTGWQGHDDGGGGRWRDGLPSATRPGKLSKGGHPKQPHALHRLGDGANGTGIDAVWRATDRGNGGKPYAIVEAKASKDEDGPKFLRRSLNTRKPGVAGTLKDNAVKDASELLEPLEEQAEMPGEGKKGGSGKSRGSPVRGPVEPSKKAKPSSDDSSSKVVKPVLVQMSHEWIRSNIGKAVGTGIAIDLLKKLPGDSRNYNRHLFYSPAYHPSGSPAQHMRAKIQNLPAEQHADHAAFHYDESEIRHAVNKRKAALRNTHGNLPGLEAES